MSACTTCKWVVRWRSSCTCIATHAGTLTSVARATGSIAIPTGPTSKSPNLLPSSMCAAEHPERSITMAKGTNKAFLLGHVGKDPEIRSTASGMTVASFSLATADRQKDSQGNWEDKAEWHSLVAFRRTAEIVRDYVKKGTQLFIEGKIQTRSWNDKATGEKTYRTEVRIH